MAKAVAIEKLVLVLLGETGSGKSAVGNTILGKQFFPSKCTAHSTTKSTIFGKCHTNGIEIVVIDTPGVFDTQEVTKDISKEMAKCVSMALSHGDGIDSFVVVLSITNQYTEEQEKFIETMNAIFGEEMMKYVSIVFSRKDQLDVGQTLDDYLKDAPDNLVGLVKQCDNRVVAFNNKTKDEEENKSQLHDLIKIIRQAKTKNGSRPFYKKDRERQEEPDKPSSLCVLM